MEFPRGRWRESWRRIGKSDIFRCFCPAGGAIISPMTKSEAQEKIEEIEEIMCGPTKVQINGRVIEYDFDALEKQLVRLQRYVSGGQNLRVGRYRVRQY